MDGENVVKGKLLLLWIMNALLVSRAHIIRAYKYASRTAAVHGDRSMHTVKVINWRERASARAIRGAHASKRAHRPECSIELFQLPVEKALTGRDG